MDAIAVVPRPRVIGGLRLRQLRLPAALLVAAALKAGLLIAGAVPFHGDEAIIALMARHILQGERPVFFYGQAYMGSLDAWLVAGAFAVLGESVAAVRVVQILLYLGTIATTYWLARRIYASEWVAGAAAVLLAIPPVMVTLYTTATLGNYGEVLLLGNLLLLLTLHLAPWPRSAADGARPAGRWHSPAAIAAGWVLFGLIAGIGFWSLVLIGVYLWPIAVYVILAERHRPARLAGHVALAVAGFAVGSAPWWGYTLQAGTATLHAAAGGGMPLPPGYHPVFAVFRHVFFFLLFGLTTLWGLRPPWSAGFLALPLIPLALAIYLVATAFAIDRLRRSRDLATPGHALIVGVALTLVLAYLLTPFGEDPTGRYFLPLAPPAAIYTAEAINWLRLRRRGRRTPWRKWFGQTLALALLAFHWWGTVQSAATNPPGITTQFDPTVQIDQRALPELMHFLRAQGETRGYTNYWVAYPLAFASREELLFAPRLPYHTDFRYTTRDLRYPRYAEAADASQRVAYITTRHPALDERLRTGLARLGVAFREQVVGDFHVFYALSRRVAPAELGLGVECCAP